MNQIQAKSMRLELCRSVRL